MLFSLPETLQQTPSSDAEDGDDDYDGDFIVTTGTPHPGWQPGDLQPHPYLDLKDEEGEDTGDGAATASDAEKAERTRERVRKALLAAPRHFVDPSKTAGSVLYPLVISAFVPRPIALVSTLSQVPTKRPENARATSLPSATRVWFPTTPRTWRSASASPRGNRTA